MNNYAEEIKTLVSMPEVAQQYGLEVNRAGFAICPFHAEKTASLRIYPKQFHCFGCGAHGSVIDFVMRYFDLSFRDALVKINTDFSLHLPIGERVTLRQQRQAERRCAEIRKQREYHQQLRAECDAALQKYIKYDRAISELAPKTPQDDFNPLFAEAVANITSAKQALQDAESRLYEYEHQ